MLEIKYVTNCISLDTDRCISGFSLSVHAIMLTCGSLDTSLAATPTLTGKQSMHARTPIALATQPPRARHIWFGCSAVRRAVPSLSSLLYSCTQMCAFFYLVLLLALRFLCFLLFTQLAS